MIYRVAVHGIREKSINRKKKSNSNEFYSTFHQFINFKIHQHYSLYVFSCICFFFFDVFTPAPWYSHNYSDIFTSYPCYVTEHIIILYCTKRALLYCSLTHWQFVFFSATIRDSFAVVLSRNIEKTKSNHMDVLLIRSTILCVYSVHALNKDVLFFCRLK